MRVANNGQGVARKVKIEFVQLRIIKNKQELAIGFEILDGQVNGQPVAPSLLPNFGDIAPEQAAVGRWGVITRLSGRLVEFTASFGTPTSSAASARGSPGCNMFRSSASFSTTPVAVSGGFHALYLAGE